MSQRSRQPQRTWNPYRRRWQSTNFFTTDRLPVDVQKKIRGYSNQQRWFDEYDRLYRSLVAQTNKIKVTVGGADTMMKLHIKIKSLNFHHKHMVNKMKVMRMCVNQHRTWEQRLRAAGANSSDVRGLVTRLVLLLDHASERF